MYLFYCFPGERELWDASCILSKVLSRCRIQNQIFVSNTVYVCQIMFWKEKRVVLLYQQHIICLGLWMCSFFRKLLNYSPSWIMHLDQKNTWFGQWRPHRPSHWSQCVCSSLRPPLLTPSWISFSLSHHCWKIPKDHNRGRTWAMTLDLEEDSSSHNNDFLSTGECQHYHSCQQCLWFWLECVELFALIRCQLVLISKG